MNDLLRELLTKCEDALGNPVEIEFAVNLDQNGDKSARFGFLQVRPMLLSDDSVAIEEEELCGDHVFIASKQVLGNGQSDSIKNIVYVKPDTFAAKDTWLIASELEEMNRRLLDAGIPYLLMVIGRLGTSDPWLGIPVNWGQVSGAKVVIEAASSGMNVEMSQGSHFFHNVTCLRILYFSMDNTGEYPLNWGWLAGQTVLHDSTFVRHVELNKPLHVKVNGKSSWGVICHEGPDTISD